jgi:hypothetical protein
MMKRRKFLACCAVAGSTPLLASATGSTAPFPKEAYVVIAAVQQHLFPEESVLPGAKAFRASEFLVATVMHPTYDREIRQFVIEGAEVLQERELWKFLHYDDAKIERALRQFEKSDYGSAWLDRIMLLSLEGLLSDPIYGGNVAESGWKALQASGGIPRPNVRYAGL